jgi:predicted DNA-binding transcriptional regulator AlpA
MSESLKEVPSLDSLVADPGRVQGLPVAVVQHLLIQVTALLPLLVAKSQGAPEKSQEDRLLTIEEATLVLGMSKDRLYRTDYPFTIRDGGLLRFSHNGIQRFIRARLRQG